MGYGLGIRDPKANPPSTFLFFLWRGKLLCQNKLQVLDETDAPAVAENHSATDIINSEETKRKKIRVRSKSRKSSSNLNLAEQLNGMKNLPVDIDPPAPVDLSVATELVTGTTGNPNVTQDIAEPENGSKRKKKKVRSRKIKPDDESTIPVEPNSEIDETPVKNLEIPGNDDNFTKAEIPNVEEQNNEEDEKIVKKRRKVRSRKSKSTELEGNQGLEILPVPVLTSENTRNLALNQEDDPEKIENENFFPDSNVEIPIESEIPDSEFKNDDESTGNLADNESEEVFKKRKKKKVRSKKSATREPEGDQPLAGFKIYHLNYI